MGVVGALWIASTLLVLARGPGWVGAGTLAAALGWAVAATFNNPLLFIQVSTVAFTIIGTGLARAGPLRAAAPARPDVAAPSDPPGVPSESA